MCLNFILSEKQMIIFFLVVLEFIFCSSIASAEKISEKPQEVNINFPNFPSSITSAKEGGDLEYLIKEKAYLKLLEENVYPYLKKNVKLQPSCFISYAWGDPKQELWVKNFSEMLEKAGFTVFFDRWEDRKGKVLTNFINKIEDADWILIIGTKLYLEKYKKKAKNIKSREHVVKVEAQLIEYLISYSTEKSDRIIPILLDGSIEESFPLMMRPKIPADFLKGDYFEELLKLIHDLYGIDNRDKSFGKIVEKFRKYSSMAEIKITEDEKRVYENKKIIETSEENKKISSEIDKFKDEVFSDFNKSSENHWSDTKNNEIWNVPEPTIFFSGRQENLLEIEENFRKNKADTINHSPKVISGCAGIGKTQLALAYAWKNKHKYKDRVRWLESETDSTLQSAWLKFAKNLEVENVIGVKKEELDHLSSDEIIRGVHEKLMKIPKMLIIFDNVEEYDKIKKYVTGIDKKHHLLITSRNKKWGNWKNIELDVFNKKEAREFIYKVLNEHYNGEETVENIDKLAEKLEYLPLALSQAVYTIGNQTTVIQYLDMYNDSQLLQKFFLSKPSFEQDNYKATVFTTWNVSKEAINKKSIEPVDILNICSYLGSDNIPKILFNNLDRSGKNISLLFEHSLVKIASYSNKYDSLTIHRLLQDVMRMQLNEEGKEKEYIKKALDLLYNNFDYNLKNPEKIPIIEQFIPHALSAIRYSYQSRVEEDKASELFKKILNFYSYWRQGFGALELAREFHRNQEKIYGIDSMKCAESSGFLAEVEYYHAHYKEAEEHYKSSIEKYENQPDFKISYEYVDVTGGLGDVYTKVGQYTKAIEQYEKTLYFLKNSNDERKMFLLGIIFHQLADVHRKLVQHSEFQRKEDILNVKNLYERSLKYKIEYYGTDNHPQVARTIRELADVSYILGNYSEAYKKIKLVLEIERSYYKTDYHPDIQKALCTLGEIQFEIGKKKEAHDSFTLATVIWKKIYPENHPGLASNFLKEGNLYLKHNFKKEANKKFITAYEVLKKKFPLDHPDIKYCERQIKNTDENRS